MIYVVNNVTRDELFNCNSVFKYKKDAVKWAKYLTLITDDELDVECISRDDLPYELVVN